MNKSLKNITVFGSARVQPGDDFYQEAYHLGSLLAGSGFTVLTGGYIGTMEAVSRGANEAGGHVVGITCEDIERWRPVKCNSWVLEERRYPTLRERLLALIDSCDAALALPGGPGTLAEVAMMWNQLLTGAIQTKPLILVGAGWKTVFEVFYTEMDAYIPQVDRRWLSFVPGAQQAVEQLRAWMIMEKSR